MATKVILPLLGQTMEEGTIIKWFKQEGETVEKGEPLLEVMTDKVNMEVESPESGTLRKILAEPEQIVPVKELIAIIGDPNETIDDLLPAASTKTVAAEEPAQVHVAAASEAPTAAVIAAPQVGADGGRVFASPRARRVAEEKGIDIAALAGRGTGQEGRVVEKDVLAYAAQLEAAPKPKVTPLAAKIASEQGIDVTTVAASGIGGRVTRDDVIRATTPAKPAETRVSKVIPMAGMRKAVADNVTKSIRTAPHVTLVTEVDMTECVRLRKHIAPVTEERYGVKISFNDIIVKSVALAAPKVPIVNSTLENDQITVYDNVNVGIAVALPDGLAAPVVRNVEAKSLVELSTEIRDLAARAREGKISGDDLKGGTITVSNLGAYGIDVFNPIINPPQAAILGVCRIVEKPAVVEGAVEVRSMMNLCLSFDHRVMDGAPAAEYLAELKSLLESPYLLLI